MADLISAFMFLEHGKPLPKKIESSKASTDSSMNVNSSTLVGYINYTTRDTAKDQETLNMKIEESGYLGYTRNRPGSEQKTFTNRGWIKNDEDLLKFKIEATECFNKYGDLAWIPVQSYKDYATAGQYGLFGSEDYAVITSKVLNKFFIRVGLEPDNMVWWMDYHSNKNHPHVHLVFLEKTKTRTKGTFTHKEIDMFKGLMFDEMRTREMLLMGTLDNHLNMLNELTKEKQMLIDKSVILTGNKHDEKIESKINKLYSHLPKDGRLQYSSSHMIQFRPEIDEIVNMILEHPDVKDDYKRLKTRYDELDQIKSSALTTKYTNISDAEDKKIRKQVANALLKNFKNSNKLGTPQTESYESMDNIGDIFDNASVEQLTDAHEFDNDTDIDSLDIGKAVLQTQNDERVKRKISKTSYNKKERKLIKSEKGYFIDWTDRFRLAQSILYSVHSSDLEKEEAFDMMKQEADNQNLLAISELSKYFRKGIFTEKNIETSETLSNTFITQAGNIIDLINEKNNYEKGDDFITNYLEYRIGKAYLYETITNKSISKAMYHLERSESGQAEYILGTLLLYKGEHAGSKQEAIYHLKKAHKESSPFASYLLGTIYEKGKYANKDVTLSQKYYQEALNGFKAILDKSQDENIMYKLAMMYDKGYGTEEDKEKALELYLQAGNLGHDGAKLQFATLSILLGRNLDVVQEYLVDLSSKQDIDAMILLANNLDGTGVFNTDLPKSNELYEELLTLEIENWKTFKLSSDLMSKNENLAYAFLKKSASDGNAFASYKLGKSSQQPETAQYWFSMAKKQIESRTHEHMSLGEYSILGTIYLNGLDGQQDVKAGLSNLFKSINYDDPSSVLSFAKKAVYHDDVEFGIIGIGLLKNMYVLGNAEAKMVLGMQMIIGKHIEQDITEGKKMIEEACSETDDITLIERYSTFINNSIDSQKYKAQRKYNSTHMTLLSTDAKLRSAISKVEREIEQEVKKQQDEYYKDYDNDYGL